MDQKLKKVKDNRCDKASKDRGDLKKTLLSKLNEDIGVNDLQRVRCPHDRGDSKAQVRNFQSSNNAEKASPTFKHKSYKDKNKTDELPQKTINHVANNDIQTIFGETPKQVANKKKIEESTLKNIAVNETADVDEPHDFIKANRDLKNYLDSGQKNRLPTSPKEVKGSIKIDTPNRTYLDFEGRKRLRERYTIKLKSNQNSNTDYKDGAKINVKNDDYIKKQTENETNGPKANESIKNNQTDTPKSTKRQFEIQNLANRKPLIRTIRLSNDNRVYNDYKSVTFQDQKEVMPLQIKIPLKVANDKIENYKSASTNTVKTKNRQEAGKNSEHVKVIKKRKERNNLTKQRAISPVTVKSFGSPQTEVAKWAPSCINGHTKPYYEAWVDTTLAAINKCSEKEKKIFKQNILKTFKRALDIDEVTRTPDLIYEKYNDETYTGRIKVRKNQSQPPPKKCKRKRYLF